MVARRRGHGCSTRCVHACVAWASPCARRRRMSAGCGASSLPTASGICARWGAGGRHRQAGHVSHLAPLLRHPPAGGRVGYPHGAGTAGPQGRVDHADLHPCAQPWRAWRAGPAGSLSREGAAAHAARGWSISTLCSMPSSASGMRPPACGTPSSRTLPGVPASHWRTWMR